jgi:hypothetical protein
MAKKSKHWAFFTNDLKKKRLKTGIARAQTISLELAVFPLL